MTPIKPIVTYPLDAIEFTPQKRIKEPLYNTPKAQELLEPLLELPDPDEVLQSSLLTSTMSHIKNLVDTLFIIEALHIENWKNQSEAWQIQHHGQIAIEREIVKDLDESQEGNLYWHLLHKIGASLIAGSSVVIGGMVCASATTPLALLAGGAMAIGGLTSIIGATIYDSTDLSDFATGLILAGSAIGLLGAIAAPALTAINATWSLAGKIAMTSLAIGANSSKLMRDSYAVQNEQLQHEFSLLEQAFAISKEDRQSLTHDATYFMRSMNEMVDDIIVSATQYQQSITKITALSGPLGQA